MCDDSIINFDEDLDLADFNLGENLNILPRVDNWMQKLVADRIIDLLRTIMLPYIEAFPSWKTRPW